MTTSVVAPVRTPPLAVAAVGGAWLLVAAAEAAGGAGRFGHDRLLHGTRPLALALVWFLVGWLVMVVAMMGPAARPAVRAHAAATAHLAHPGPARAGFVGGYLLVWATFGALLFSGDALLHALVDESSAWIRGHGLVAGTVLVAAGLATARPAAGRRVQACRHSTGRLAATPGGRGVREGFATGRDQGMACVACCWGPMVVMFAFAVTSLVAMGLVAALMAYERVGARGVAVARLVGVALVAGGIAVLAERAIVVA